MPGRVLGDLDAGFCELCQAKNERERERERERKRERRESGGQNLRE